MNSFIKREPLIFKISFLLALCIVIGLLTSCSSTPAGSSGGSLFSKKITPVSEFSNGLAVVEKDGEYGYIDTIGRVVIPIQFSKAASFKDGAALVTLSSEDGTSYDAYIDAHGEVVFDFREYKDEYDTIFQYSEGLLGVAKTTGSNEERCGIIDIYGNILMPLNTTWLVREDSECDNGYMWLDKRGFSTDGSYFLNDSEYIQKETREFAAFDQRGNKVSHGSLESSITESGGVKSIVNSPYKFVAGCNVYSRIGVHKYYSDKNSPVLQVGVNAIYHPAQGVIFSKGRQGEYPFVFFWGDVGEACILIRTSNLDAQGTEIHTYNVIDTNSGELSADVNLGGTYNTLKDIYGFSQGIAVIHVEDKNGKNYQYYINKNGEACLSPQTEYELGDMNDGYAVWRKSGEDGKSYAYIVNKDFRVISDPIPFDGAISQRLRFKNGYCLLTQDGVPKYIDTQGETLVIQDYQKGQAPIKLTDEMRIPDLTMSRTAAPIVSDAIVTPSPTPAQPNTTATPSRESLYQYHGDNSDLLDYMDKIYEGRYFANKDNGYVAYITNMSDGTGSVFVNGQEVMQFEVFSFIHDNTNALFDYTPPGKDEEGVIIYYYKKDNLSLIGTYEGKDFTGMYEYAPNEPPLPEDNIWGDYSSAWLEDDYY
ncbi:MAG: WG repeat-containing protein [Candidatus Pelethousia sp.]|nr:WG repeat-containing protein [Candidatus Pelethousia sp.]